MDINYNVDSDYFKSELTRRLKIVLVKYRSNYLGMNQDSKEFYFTNEQGEIEPKTFFPLYSTASY